jgi:conjugative transposon TraM protein
MIILLFDAIFCAFDDTKPLEVNDKRLETTYGLNDKLPDAQMHGDGIGNKLDNMKKAFGETNELSALDNINPDDDVEQKEAYESKYSEADIALLDAQAAAYTDSLDREAKTQEERDRATIDELNRALAKARLQGQSLAPTDTLPAPAQGATAQVAGTVEMESRSVSAPDEDAPVQQVVKRIAQASDYFHTIGVTDAEPKLIKAIIDEEIKAVDGSRVRLRLLDDIEINDAFLPKGSYLYATMSGFGSQRVKGAVKSILVDDEILKVNLTLYDTDGLEGLYVPGSNFRDTGKDIASGAMSGNMTLNNTTSGNSFSQWGMQAIQNAYQKTSNAISKAIKKNSAKLKYGTFVYLVNGKEKKNN